MKNLLKSIAFLVISTACIFLYFEFTVNRLNKDYLVSYGRGFEGKFEKLRRVEANKIVIVGGSNVNFGIDSDIMEISLGVPVVNMGLHGGLNTFTMIDPIRPYLKRGDLLIISREFNEKLYGSSIEVSNYFQFMPLRAKWEVYKNLDAIAPVLKSHVQNSQNNLINLNIEPQDKFKQGVYRAKAFKNDNVYKNIIDFEMPKSMYEKFKTEKLNSPNSLELFQYYRDLKEDLNNKGIKVYFSMPAIAKDYFPTEDILAYYKILTAKTGIDLLSYNTSEFPAEKLSNSMYHLNAVGRQERSLALCKDLMQLDSFSIKTVDNFFYASSTKAKPEELKFNDYRQCKLVDSQLTYFNTNKNDLANYSRIKVSAEGDPFTKRYFKIVVDGDSSLIKDLKFRAVGSPQEWDSTYLDNTKHVLIKNKIQGTIYKDGNAYLGLSLNHLDKHHNQNIKIHTIEISSTPFNVQPSVILNLNENITIDSHTSNAELTFKIGSLSNKFKVEPNTKYTIINQNENLLITHLYTGETFKFKKSEPNQVVNIQFPEDIMEVFRLK